DVDTPGVVLVAALEVGDETRCQVARAVELGVILRCPDTVDDERALEEGQDVIADAVEVTIVLLIDAHDRLRSGLIVNEGERAGSHGWCPFGVGSLTLQGGCHRVKSYHDDW